jgi:hypothetical protein
MMGASADSMRVRRVERYHCFAFSRYVSDRAWASFFTGSSMMARCAPRPVRVPPTPAVNMAPRRFTIVQEFRARLS